MKYIKNYNESIKDYLKPKSSEEIDKGLMKLSNQEIIEKSLKYIYLNGLKIVVSRGLSNQDIDLIIDNLNRETTKEIFEYLLSIKEIKQKFNENNVYIIEKYILGLHQNEMKDFERWFLEQLTDLKIDRYEYNENILVYIKNYKILFNYDLKNEIFYCSYYKIRSIFRTEFKLNYLTVSILVKGMVEKHLRLRVNTTRDRFIGEIIW